MMECIIPISRGVYNTNNQIKFKTSMLGSSLHDYSDAHILVKGNITVPNTVGQPHLHPQIIKTKK